MFKTDLPGFTIWSADSHGFWSWIRAGLPVVTTPEVIDIVNSDELRWRLMTAAAHGNVVVADLSATAICDCSGLRVLAEVGSMLEDTGGELRAVIRSALVLKCLAILGDDRRLRIFPHLPDALAGSGQILAAPSQAA